MQPTRTKPLAHHQPPVKAYLLTLCYDGSQFAGWAMQPNANPTVQGTLMAALKRLFKQPIAVIGASRTDRGVHALSQLAVVALPATFDARKLQQLLNQQLPLSVRCLKVTPWTKTKPLRTYIQSKTYVYHLKDQVAPAVVNVFDTAYCYYRQLPVNCERLQTIMNEFVDEHNFFYFAKLKPHELAQRQIIRTIKTITVKRSDSGLIVITVEAPGFLRYQIRMIIQAALLVHDQRWPLEALKARLSSQPDRFDLFSKPAPIFAGGLYLKTIQLAVKS